MMTEGRDGETGAGFRLPAGIEAERVVIRPLTAPDREAFVALMTDREATRFVFCDEQKTAAGARAFFDLVTASYAGHTPYFLYAITVEDGFAGVCGISRLPGDGVFECVVCLSPRHRRQGYATETVRALIGYCFDNYAIEQFRSYVSPENPRSVAIAKRLDMRHEGRGKHPLHGDQSEIYSISRKAYLR